MYEPKRERNEQPIILEYVPHGVNPKHFHKITSLEELNAVMELRKNIFGDSDAEVEFVLLYNSRNIRRKMTSDIIMAFRKFYLDLPKEKRVGVRLILHTQPVDDNGTDLPAVIRDCASEIAANVVFSHARVDIGTLNRLYNIADGVILLSDNEGWGLSLTESMMAETMFIANVTGGMQDQMGFRDEKGNFLDEDKHYKKEWGSNANGRYKVHGEWCLPIFPNNSSLNGSPITPYIFSDRCDSNEAAGKIRELYDMSKEERDRRGALGREYCMSQGLNVKEMCNRLVQGIEHTFTQWKPRARFGVYRI